jgi:hypothetical protein
MGDDAGGRQEGILSCREAVVKGGPKKIENIQKIFLRRFQCSVFIEKVWCFHYTLVTCNRKGKKNAFKHFRKDNALSGKATSTGTSANPDLGAGYAVQGIGRGSQAAILAGQ